MNDYQAKFVTPEQAVKAVQSGDWVDYGFGAGFPELLDKAPDEARRQIQEILGEIEGVVKSHDLRVRSAGDKYEIDVNIHVDRNLSIVQAHDIAERARLDRAALAAHYGGVLPELQFFRVRGDAAPARNDFYRYVNGKFHGVTFLPSACRRYCTARIVPHNNERNVNKDRCEALTGAVLPYIFLNIYLKPIEKSRVLW